ncbi:MAG TPA: hypothetical protein VIE13_04660 [Terriglobales bacterium]|jgi:hypothetical protein
MKPTALAALAAVWLCAANTAQASPRLDFNQLVDRVAVALHCRPQHPHLVGMVSFFARLSHPHEARGMHIAIFETHGESNLDAVAGALDAGWTQIIRHDNYRDHEQARIFVRQDGKRFQMLIANLDDDGEAQLVTLEVAPGDLIHELDRHRSQN